MFLSDGGIFRKRNKNGAIWGLSLSAAVFYLTPVASDGFRSALKPSAFDPEKKDGNLSAQIISQEQPVSETAALNPDWVGMAHGLPERMNGHKPPEGKKPGRDVPKQEMAAGKGVLPGRERQAAV